MIVLLTCTPSLKDIWPGSTIEMRSIRHLWPFCGCCGPGLCAYLDENALSCRACFVNDYTERQRNMVYELSWPSNHVNLTRACMVQTPKNIQVLGQPSHRCRMTLKMRWFRIGQELVLLQSENWFAASPVCVRLFLTLEVAMRLIFLTVCVTLNMLQCCLQNFMPNPPICKRSIVGSDHTFWSLLCLLL